MSTLEKIRAKYNLTTPNLHEPNPSCKFCKGTGEKPLKHKRHNILTGEELPDTHIFCICLFVDHSVSDDVGTSLGEFAKKQKEQMKSEGSNE